MIAVIAASLGLHAVVVGTAVMSGQTAPAPQQEIAVDLVEEAPKPAPELKPSLSPDALPELDAKAEASPKVADAKAQPSTAEPSKVEPKTAEAAKVEQAQGDSEPPSREAEPAVRDMAKLDPPKAAPAPSAEETKTSLESQLAALKAEQAALEADRTTQQETQVQAKTPAKTPATPVDTALGPLPDSFQAVALPATSDAAEEAVSYQQIVFSQLAKAKEIGRQQGLPGSAGVHFSIDESGRLLNVEIIHKSGVASLDAEAASIVRKAAPFPPPPQGAQRSFDANVNFVVESAR